ncbi:MAG TPA: TIGR03960 family B12-binding radical SAM protein [Coriobacteriia bacterium]|nr:TIGR03960 family B12-binding radical SAM protein [Coriobacteriia bacterium]
MTTSNLWDRLEPLLASVERPARYIDHEFGAQHKAADYRVALIYPDTYEIGQANQAIAILYDCLNAIDGVAAERCYLPWLDLADKMREHEIPLFTLESTSPVAECELVGITLPYELTYSNIVEALDLAGIAPRAADRGEGAPLVIGGGPCAFNPEPVADFFDAILIGEGEEAAGEMVAVHRACIAEGASRAETLRRLAQVGGVYVPSLYTPVRAEDGSLVAIEAAEGAPARVEKRIVADLDSVATPACPVVPFMDVIHDRQNVEILRGCTRGCRFCQAGMVYRPVRERSADTIVKATLAGLACTGYDEVSLTSLSSADHSQIEDVLRRLMRRLTGTGVSVSLPSLRVDAFSVDLARLISSGKKSGLTFAPEAGTQRLRDVINKNVVEEDLINTVRAAFEAGWRRVKLYFMIGLPTETDEDIQGIGQLVYKVLTTAREATPPSQRGGLKIGVSVSTFVPKAETPFQWEPMLTLEEVRRRQGVLRESMPHKGVDLSWHESEVSILEGVMARGGREISAVIEAAWRRGARFDAWTEQYRLNRWVEALEECGVDPVAIANRTRDVDEVLPWEHLTSGVSARYLVRERERAYSATTTPDCSFGGCTGCDVCGDLGVDVLIAGGERR